MSPLRLIVIISLYLSKVFSHSTQISSHTGLISCSKEVEGTCPPGLFCKGGYCKCGAGYVYPYFFQCSDSNVSVLPKHCATFDSKHNIVQTGSCFYYHVKLQSPNGMQYHKLPSDIHQLNNITCNTRDGPLCGRCLPDHYPLAYSFNLTCIPCPHAGLNWLWYIMAAYLPLTLFYFIIIFFKINITSSHLFAVVYYCQTIATPVLVVDLLNSKIVEAYSVLFWCVQTLSTLYGIWNLDFFRPFYSSFCLEIGILPTLALDYAIAVYPFLLMIISYLLIELHDRNYQVIVTMWRPFRKVSSMFRRNWDIRTSVIDAYATFFFLSSMKLLTVSLSLLAPVHVYSLYEDHYNYTLGVYYAADIEYFGREHLPYALLAIVVLCLCFILPVTALAIYPFSCFQKFLSLFPFRWFILRTFMDSFHGCYKNRTEPSTRDYRWFVATFLLTRSCLLLIYFAINNNSLFSPLITIFLVLHTTILATLQPFKSYKNNVINIIFMLLLTLLAVTVIALQTVYIVESGYLVYFFFILSVVLAYIPVLYAVAIVLHWIYSHRRFSLSMLQWIRARRHGYTQLPIQARALPDRIENSGNYPRENLAKLMAQTD